MSAEGLKIAHSDGVLVLTLANPPQNALTPDLRAAVLREILAAPKHCQGIVLAADGPAFSAHLPAEPDPAQPRLAALCEAVADCPLPVVAVLRGRVTGPGAELALAARARLADPSLRFAFADVTLGLCPAGGSSQRLPRLIGAVPALRLLLTGQPALAAEALSLGLIDGLDETAPLAAGVRLARALAVSDILPRTPPDPTAWQAAVRSARRDASRLLPAPQRIIDCVEAALLLPKPAGFALEATLRADLEASPEAAGLRASALAERRALALPSPLARLHPPPVNRIGLVGTAPDLARLAVAALSCDVEVGWAVASEAERRDGLAAVDLGIEAGRRAGRLTLARARQMTARLLVGAGPDVLAAAQLVVQGQDDPVGLAAGMPGPAAARLVLGEATGAIGLVLAPAGRGCELVLPPGMAPLTQATAVAGVRRIGLSPILVGRRAVVGARMADAGRTALAWMISHGVPLRLVRAALDSFGLQMAEPVSAEAPAILRAMSGTEVLHRWLAALANEGARLLGEGIARRPSDIDHLMVSGLAFPRWQGGPMHQADRRGLMAVRADLRVWGAEAALWAPAPLFDDLIRDGEDLAALNAAQP